MSSNMKRHRSVNGSTSSIMGAGSDDSYHIEPSPKRVRNMLTLEERVCAIQAYDCRPMYTKIAKMFNCSWEQIKNIIQNRNGIMEFYEATKRDERINNTDKDEIRERKIGFLGECLYEYIQRFQFHTKKDITEDIIRTKANEFRKIIQIPKFVPNKGWLNHFKATYNFSLSNRQVTLTRIPPASLQLTEIMTYCTKHKPTVELNFTPQERNIPKLHRWRTEVNVQNIHNAAVRAFPERRERKMKFLETALHEFMQRAQFHSKAQVSDVLLLHTAQQLSELLKIDDFQRDPDWLSEWKAHFNVTEGGSQTNGRTPPLSLDLRDILSYCSRNISRKSPKPTHITLEPADTVPAFKKIKLVSPKQQSQISHEPTLDVKEEVIDLDDDSVNKAEEDIHEIIVKPDISDFWSADSNCETSSIKIEASNAGSIAAQSPGHWSEHSDQGEELPRVVRNYEDALKLLKPLEEFVMLQEHYRAIGLISQLEDIFKLANKKN